ncbi:MAG: hypothetical protein HY748_09645 [Elusimicrobia bacterium]|nr:hypothetical protein [Elusimicrobiota bacterium]
MTTKPPRKHKGPGRSLPPLLIGGRRIMTSLTLARSRQAYLWFTDRGRSRILIRF